MASPSEANAASAVPETVASLLPKLNPAEIEVDSLGRIIVKSAELRESLRRAAVQARSEELGAEAAPTNGSQCACHNIQSCHGHPLQ